MTLALKSKSLTLNTLSNFIASAWSAVLNLLFVPVYVSYLGIEAYGLVGFYATLVASLSILDLGLRPTISREMARYSVMPNLAQDARDLARTLEVIYWILAIIIGVGVSLFAEWIALNWVQARVISVETVQRAVVYMGIVAAVQWPVSFYTGGLQGLQHQVLLNTINISVSSVRFVGAALILMLVSPTITAFFSWQILVSLIQCVLFIRYFWHKLPVSERRPRIRSSLMLPVWRFAAGMGMISALSLLLSQSDKLLLSRMLPLNEFGYYILAVMLAQLPMLLSGPITNAVFPRFIQLVSQPDQLELTNLFHRTSQLVSVGVLPIALTLALFAPEITYIWTRNSEVSLQISLLVSLLTIGTLSLTLQTVPHTLALAHGWTKPSILLSLMSVVLIVPSLYYLVNHFGAIGGGITWLVLNAGTLPMYARFVHSRLLPGEEKRWYLHDIALPLAASLIPLALSRYFLPTFQSSVLTLLAISMSTAISFVVTVLAVPYTRTVVMQYVWHSTLVQRRTK